MSAHDVQAHGPPGPRTRRRRPEGRQAGDLAGGEDRPQSTEADRLLEPLSGPDTVDHGAITAYPSPERVDQGVLVLDHVVLAIPHGLPLERAGERWSMTTADGDATDVWVPNATSVELRTILPARDFVSVPRWRQNGAHDAHVRPLAGVVVKVGPVARKRATVYVECHDGSEHPLEVPVGALDDLLADLDDEGVVGR